ncbi:MAG: beta-galactosidase [Proteobacteria bacterium]|nr:beta-galactosidase [Pseudomonadota bacterium]
MIGVYYYPEQWPRDQWERDIRNIKKMGMHYIHMAEFSWIHLEPVEGTFSFDWLDQAIDLAIKEDLKIILCTPTATPPVWMSHNYPETLMVKKNGRRVTHGSRAQRCVNSKLFNQFSEKIGQQFGKRYGMNPAIVGWQLDNEVGHYSEAPCYCDSCHSSFIEYLKSRYQNIENLNEAWAGDFWSQNYQNFDQIHLPNQESLPYLPNEHALLDFQRFYSLSLAGYLERQSEFLRPYLHKNTWITHNFMKDDPWFFPGHIKKGIDLYTLSLYPVAGLYQGVPKRELHRLGDPYVISFNHDSIATHNGHWGVMEQQPGQVNWGPRNVRPYPGTTRLWLWTAIAHGAEHLNSYRYRQPRSGAEQYHEGLVGLDGIKFSSGGRDFTKVSEELDSFKYLFDQSTDIEQLKAAFLVDWDSIRAINNHPQSESFDAHDCLNRFYKALKKLGLAVDIIHPHQNRDLSQYSILCIGLVDLTEDHQILEWQEFVQQGGHLILSPRIATRNQDGHFPETEYGQRLKSLTGASLDGYDMMLDGEAGTLQLSRSGKEISWSRWGEQYDITPDMEPLALFTDQFYKGKVAAFKKRIADGTLTCIGFDQSEGIEKLISESLMEEFDQICPLPEQSLFMIRGNLGIFLNYNDQPVLIPDRLLSSGEIISGSSQVQPADLCLIKYEQKSEG